MRPRSFPQLYDDTLVIDEPRVFTKVYDQTLKQPAIPLSERFPIAFGFLNGAPVDLISHSLAAGCRWRIGPVEEAAWEASGHTVIWLSPLDFPYDKQIAAWWIGGPHDAR